MSLKECEKKFKKKELLPLNSSGSQEKTKETLEQQGKIYLDGTEQPISRPRKKLSKKKIIPERKSNILQKSLF